MWAQELVTSWAIHSDSAKVLTPLLFVPTVDLLIRVYRPLVLDFVMVKNQIASRILIRGVSTFAE